MRCVVQEKESDTGERREVRRSKRRIIRVLREEECDCDCKSLVDAVNGQKHRLTVRYRIVAAFFGLGIDEWAQLTERVDGTARAEGEEGKITHESSRVELSRVEESRRISTRSAALRMSRERCESSCRVCLFALYYAVLRSLCICVCCRPLRC